MEIQLLFSLIFVFAAKGLSEAVSITPPTLVKKNSGENCKLQWMVSGTFFNYTITYSKNGTSKNLGPNTDTDYDSVKGIITLNIWDVQTQDAGYYVLTLYTGAQPPPSSSGVLFVYGYFYINVINLSGKTEITEGDVIEFNCSATSNFTPPGFQTKLNYFWYDEYNGYLQNTSRGPAIKANGDAVAGYSLKNNGQILSIDTAQIEYFSDYYNCQAQEEGSLYKSSFYSTESPTLSHRPFIYYVSPLSKKWNSPSSWGYVWFQFVVSSFGKQFSYSNWSFVNASGNRRELPVRKNLPQNAWTYFIAPDEVPHQSYGNLTITLSNSIGPNSITFQHLPPGVPDSPGDFKVQYVTYSVVSLQWRCGWHNGEPQTVTVTLTNIADNKIVETLKTSLAYNSSCYNSLFSSTFRSAVMPDTDYMASIWSTNLYGRSRVATLSVKTPVKPTFSVSCEDISFTESTAIVKVSTSVVEVWLNVSCCVEKTAQCIKQSNTLLTSQNQIIIDPIPTGDDYLFDFLLFNRSFNYAYNLAVIKGLKKSRSAGCNTVNENRSLLIAVIVLASLLGVAALVIIICLVVNLRLRGCIPTKENGYEQEINVSSSANNPASETYLDPIPNSNYEGITEDDEEHRFYTSLDRNPPPPPLPPQIPRQQS